MPLLIMLVDITRDFGNLFQETLKNNILMRCNIKNENIMYSTNI